VNKKIHLYEDKIGYVQLVDHMGTDLTIVNSARVSFGREKHEIDERDKKLINYLVKHKHTSTFEHNVVTFSICVPLFVRSQHMRHRTWSYNEISRRYTEVDIEFYEPKSFRTQHPSNRQASNAEELVNPLVRPQGITGGTSASWLVRNHNKKSLKLYNELIDAGLCREQARGVLPQNMYTKYYGTVDLNNLIKFINLRLHSGAQWEIQQLAKGMLEIANSLWPIATQAYMENTKGK
jgi:thymidylate synthase (FAD)